MKKKILILGSSGYLGRAILKNLKKSFKFYHLSKKKNEFNQIKKILTNHKINLIINLVNSSKSNEIIKYNKNLIKSVEYNPSKIIFFSTSLIYGKTLKAADENAKVKTFNKYTKMKSNIENIYKNSAINYKIIRLANVYDNRLQKKGIFKNLMNCIENKKSNIKFNDLNIYRNFIHLDDTINLLERLILYYDNIHENIINFGGENIKLRNIVNLFNKKFDTKINVKIKKSKLYDPSIMINSNFSHRILNYKNLNTLANTINQYRIIS